MNEMINTVSNPLDIVTAALTPLKEINDLYLAADAITQRKAVNTASARNNASATGKKKLYTKVSHTSALLTIPCLLILYPLASKFKFFAYILIIYLLASGVYCAYLFFSQRKKYIADAANASSAENEKLDLRLQQISDAIYRISSNNEAAITAIPRDYRYYDAVSFFESALVNGRADSMKEAINLYESHLHMKALESDSQAMLRMNQRQSEMLGSINASSNAAARNSEIAATFSVLSFLNSI